MNVIAQPLLHFTPVDLCHRERYLALADGRYRDADRAFANLYIWNETYHQEIAFFDADNAHFAVIRFCTDSGPHRYLFPVGYGSPAPVIQAMQAQAAFQGGRLIMAGVTEEEVKALNDAFPNRFSVTEERDLADYLYDATALSTLAGKKLHAKRNHINAFTATHHWVLHPLSPDRFDQCRALLDTWGAERTDPSVQNERKAVERALDAFDALALEGGVLTVDDAPVAFTIGSMLTADTLCVHVEKAHPDFSGAYPVINREFVRLMHQKHPSLTTVNREDDMGLENLRRAKMSYRPSQLLTKYLVLDTF